MASRAEKAKVVGAFGARGTGKTAWLKQALSKEPRLAVWDYKGDPRMRGWGQEFNSLPAFARAMMASKFLLRYIPRRSDGRLTVEEQFEAFCQACMECGCMAMFVDELPAVTRANKAPDAWRECVNVGREYSTQGQTRIKWLSIYATAQRPSECDKSFISNLDVLHTGRLSFANDAKVIAQSLGVKPDEVLQMQDLEWIEKRAESREIFRGKLSFGNARAAAKTAP